MALKTVTRSEFKATVNMNGIVVVDFYADWCGPCKQFAPIFQTAAEEHQDITFLKVNTDVEQVLSQELEITSIPTIMVYRNSNIVFKQAGALAKQSFEHLIRSVRELDIDALSAKAAR